MNINYTPIQVRRGSRGLRGKGGGANVYIRKLEKKCITFICASNVMLNGEIGRLIIKVLIFLSQFKKNV